MPVAQWKIMEALPLDGSQRLQLSYPPTIAAMPRWSPDGKHVAFPAGTPGGALKILLVSAEGGNPQELLPEDKQTEDDPTGRRTEIPWCLPTTGRAVKAPQISPSFRLT